MAKYAVSNSTNFGSQSAVTTTYIGMVAFATSTQPTNFNNATAPPTYGAFRRGKIYDLLVGTNGTPADNAVEWAIQRCTIGATNVWVGSVSSVSSAFALDTADVNFGAYCTVNASQPSTTAFPTPSQNLPWYVGVNQRASYRWVAAPGSEIVWPAVSSSVSPNAIAGVVRSVYTGTATMTIFFEEQ